ncbi:MAG: peptidylprolyl isomerase [Acidimicrobiales bacterium]
MSPPTPRPDRPPAPRRLWWRRAVKVAATAPVLAAVALATTACHLSPYAAIVNGQVISQQTLTNELDAISTNRAYAQSLQRGSSGLVIKGQGSNGHTYDTRFVDAVLSRQISFSLIHQAVVKRGLTISPSDLALAKADAAQSVGGTQVFSSFPGSYQDALVRHSADVTALESSLAKVPVGPAALQRYYQAHPKQFRNYCVTVVAVTSKAQALTIRSAIAGGTSPAQAAKAVSGAQEGSLGCHLPSAYAGRFGPSFAHALQGLTTGQLSQPVQTSLGWLVAKLDKTQAVPFSQATPAIRAALLGGSTAKAVSYIDKLEKAASVKVDPRYGRFSTSKTVLGVTAPAPPPSKDLALPNGVTASGGSGLPGSAPPGTTSPPTTTSPSGAIGTGR